MRYEEILIRKKGNYKEITRKLRKINLLPFLSILLALMFSREPVQENRFFHAMHSKVARYISS
jgi:hypothetical protein